MLLSQKPGDHLALDALREGAGMQHDRAVVDRPRDQATVAANFGDDLRERADIVVT